jgi:hypothetical protein
MLVQGGPPPSSPGAMVPRVDDPTGTVGVRGGHVQPHQRRHSTLLSQAREQRRDIVFPLNDVAAAARQRRKGAAWEKQSDGGA